MVESGLLNTLHWMVDSLEKTQAFVDQSVVERSSISYGHDPRDGSPVASYHHDNMKRRFPANADESYKRQHADFDSAGRHRSSPASSAAGDELPSISTRSSFQSGMMSNVFGPRMSTSNMNHPPVPGQPLPSPPAPRTHQSPSSYNIASPSTSYGQVTTPVSLPPPAGLLQASIPNLVQPLSPSSSSETAAQAHSAALQHEISVRTLALQSLQSEHNNLLAAFSRSQTRAGALERKNNITDLEISTLTEERNQLQARISDLEQSIEEVSKSRNEARQSAVQEGAQYVEIVKMASKLEELAMHERKSWTDQKVQMEERIRALESGQQSSSSRGITSSQHRGPDFQAVPRVNKVSFVYQ